VNESLDAMLAILERGGSGLSEVTRLVSQLEKSGSPTATTAFGLSGNVTLDLLGTYLRKQAVLLGQRADVQVGAFDDHLGNVKRFVADGCDAIVVLDLFDAFQPALEARVSEMGDDEIAAQADRYRQELALMMQEAAGIPDVFVSRLHRLSPPPSGPPDPIDRVVALFDEVTVEEAARFKNVHLISTSAISAQVGWANAHDIRSYERFRSPFTPAFLDRIASEVYDATRGFGSYYFKALVLDCDGTLWGGLLGDDLASGIKVGPFTYPGSMFWRMQHEFLTLQRQGVLLCLSSKNDAPDVDAVLASHPDMVLRAEHFVAKRVNWDDKVANLESLAGELGIGLDSMVFVDDSTFECESVRSRLPMVRTFQVPSDLSEYPQLITQLKRLFAVARQSGEGGSKSEQYRSRRLANEARQAFASQEEYLASLEMRVEIRRNDPASSSRIAELTQKSNQFNLTTRRYSVAQVESLMADDDVDVFSIHVADKFGDAGLTGVLITRRDGPDGLSVDAFLMSCRVLGRGVESSFWEVVRTWAVDQGRQRMTAEYLPTAKNSQTCDFWDSLGLTLVSEDESGRREYSANLASVRLGPPPAHIEVTHGF
jgi:FkbH-like protein